MKIVVHHIGPACVQCNQTKRMMDSLKIEYEQVDLRENPDLVEKFKELGHLTAPIVTAGERIWSGFRFEKIKDLAMKLDLEHAHD
jgi:glutaredoxin-like protein NrdH